MTIFLIVFLSFGAIFATISALIFGIYSVLGLFNLVLHLANIAIIPVLAVVALAWMLTDNLGLALLVSCIFFVVVLVFGQETEKQKSKRELDEKTEEYISNLSHR